MILWRCDADPHSGDYSAISSIRQANVEETRSRRKTKIDFFFRMLGRQRYHTKVARICLTSYEA